MFSVSDSPGSQKGLKIFSFSLLCFPDFFFGFPPLFLVFSVSPAARFCVPSVRFVFLDSRSSRVGVPFSRLSPPLPWKILGHALLFFFVETRCRGAGSRVPEGAGLCFSTLSLWSPPFSGVRDLARRSLRRV